MKHLIIIVGLVGLAAQINAQAPACAEEPYRQFDFWLGQWKVYGTDSLGQEKLLGTNRIERQHKGCVIQEHWSSAVSGHSGTSLNYYNPQDSSWHQLWVSNTGNILNLKGGRQGRKMVMLSPATVSPQGQPYRNRLSWTPRPDGSVRQLWEVGSDSTGWTPVFDGLYRPQTDQ